MGTPRETEVGRRRPTGGGAPACISLQVAKKLAACPRGSIPASWRHLVALMKKDKQAGGRDENGRKLEQQRRPLPTPA